MSEEDDYDYSLYKPAFVGIGSALETVSVRAGTTMEINQTTESPIETIFGAAALEVFSEHFKDHKLTTFRRCAQEEVSRDNGSSVLMVPQFWWRNYRMDWAFVATFMKQPYVFVECDGKDFHSSPEQLARDRKKDDEVGAAGIPIFRFTGKDINRNARACAMVVLNGQRQAYLEECRKAA